MLFSSMIFLWLFLPITLVAYFIIDKKYKNLLLTIVSLIFYAWGEPKYVVLILIVIFINYVYGLLIDRFNKNKKLLIVLCIATNLAILAYFKYYNFIVMNVNRVVGSEIFGLKQIILPIGISFYIFQTLSYVVDLYRGEIKVQKNIINLALYTSFFPQLIAGPIVKYHDIAEQINSRTITKEKFAYGIKRFIYGLSKKVIISNMVAEVVDNILAIDTSMLSRSVMWLAILLYTLQIYYDFSGYSDMAIGLGKMFGFDILENFNYPYISKSVTEFWRRWHISLSTWFKEYVYIPLGGNRKGKYRTYINLSIVFLLTGIWHGASFNFVLWGLLHGFFMVIERVFLLKVIEKNWFTKILGHIYTLGVVIIAWALFRAESLRQGLGYIKVMLLGNDNAYAYGIEQFVDNKLILIVIIAVAFCGIVQSLFKKLKTALFDEENIVFVESVIQLILFGICIMLLVNNTYNPFIYFKF